MRHLSLFLASAVALGLAPYELRAQTTAAPPAVTTAPVPDVPPPAAMAPKADDDDDDLPSATVPGATQTGEHNDWTFEEVMGGEVKVGPEVSPVALGVGAVAGVVAFNVLAQYVFPGSSLLSQTFVAETASTSTTRPPATRRTRHKAHGLLRDRLQELLPARGICDRRRKRGV